MLSGRTIFISPLDWGFGHATRCIPIIRELAPDNKIILGVTKITQQVFKEEFPQLEAITVPSYNVRYSSVLPLWLKLLLDAGRLRSVIREENKFLGQIITKYKIDCVISDNRFGLYSKSVRTIFITHQMFLRTPFATWLAQRINKNYIRNFDEVWIPDYAYESESLSGALSHGEHFHQGIKYIGPKTRLKISAPLEKKYDFLLLLSGPEPRQSMLKDLLLKSAAQCPDKKFALAAVSVQSSKVPENTEVFVSPDNNTLSQLIASSEKVVCRSGYSSLMDLHLLKKEKLILIPTPGQTEQEYLADHWQKKFAAQVVLQNRISPLIFR